MILLSVYVQPTWPPNTLPAPSVTPPSSIRYTSQHHPLHLPAPSVTPPNTIRYTSQHYPLHLPSTIRCTCPTLSVTPPLTTCYTSPRNPFHLPAPSGTPPTTVRYSSEHRALHLPAPSAAPPRNIRYPLRNLRWRVSDAAHINFADFPHNLPPFARPHPRSCYTPQRDPYTSSWKSFHFLAPSVTLWTRAGHTGPTQFLKPGFIQHNPLYLNGNLCSANMLRGTF